MATRKGLGKGLGKGYKNLKPTFMHDRKVHATSARGIMQPQRMPAMLKLQRRAAVAKLRKGLKRGMTLCTVHQIYYDSNQGRWSCPMCEQEVTNAIEKAMKKRKGGKLLAKDFNDMPTLAQGQADDLKFDNGKIRIWVSRVDGSVSTERYNQKAGRWDMVDAKGGKGAIRRGVNKIGRYDASGVKEVGRDIGSLFKKKKKGGKNAISRGVNRIGTYEAKGIVEIKRDIGGKRIRKGKSFFQGDKIKQGSWSDKRWAKARHKDNAQIGKDYEDWEKSKYQRWK